MVSTVYFTDTRAAVKEVSEWYQPQLSAVKRLENLVERSGILDSVEKGDIVALKVHFGERGTTRQLRSVFMRKVAMMVSERGGDPFFTETCGLGMTRATHFATGRIEVAEENGYTHQTLQAPIIIADGLRGFDGVRVEVDGIQLKEVYVARAIAECDRVICLAHFKGHQSGSFGGALKGIGVGCTAKPSKYDVHIDGYPEIDEARCNRCGECEGVCPASAIEDGRIDPGRCIKCGGCLPVCREDAIRVKWVSPRDLDIRFVDCAKAVMDLLGHDRFAFVNFLLDVTPHCDCHPYSDNPIVADIGILASGDILAIDKASLDLVNEASPLPASMAEGLAGDKFSGIFPWTDPSAQIDAAERLGLGEREYELVRVG
ncbi:MAG TPA: DUF362 domain-containing protein [Candidatus Syntrophoarchaeum butanivorans]|uniref:DUF362 domain-containing protein n=1 Tax=Candidatus Syntropharchaeum butanivorans TaxID=1839936 RepID=A0A7C1B4D7_9EURY|nr:DUF362 domain-containing protein [Candidatus Syntrophoarchaeum butanivorans]